jgi:hypothetical protein
LVSGERLHVAGHGLDDPKIPVPTDVFGDLPAFVKQLMGRLVIDGAGFLIGTGEEIGGAFAGEIDSQRHLDLRLRGAELVVVLGTRAVIDDVVLRAGLARQGIAGGQ